MRLTRFIYCTALVLIQCCFSSLASAEDTLRVCFWNVESGGASSNVNKARIAGEDGVDIWGLSEVRGPTDAAKYLLGAADGEDAAFESILGTTGGADRLQIIFNADKLELIESEELHDINVGGNVRAPLVARFRMLDNDQEFLFMVNHLYRGSAPGRHTQARKLNDWAEEQDLPAIVGGDMNFDWHYENGEDDHDEGYDLLIEDDVFTWVEPDVLVPTNSSHHESVLDFVFVSGDAMTWPAESTILVQPGEWPDGPTRSDHRPVDCVFTITDEISPTELAIPRVLTMEEAKNLAAEDHTAMVKRRPSETTLEEIADRVQRIETELKEIQKRLDSRKK